jgi:hypothetical protein
MTRMDQATPVALLRCQTVSQALYRKTYVSPDGNPKHCVDRNHSRPGAPTNTNCVMRMRRTSYKLL